MKKGFMCFFLCFVLLLLLVFVVVVYVVVFLIDEFVLCWLVCDLDVCLVVIVNVFEEFFEKELVSGLLFSMKVFFFCISQDECFYVVGYCVIFDSKLVVMFLVLVEVCCQ